MALEDVQIPNGGALHWMDADRFISVEGQGRHAEMTEPWQIHLRTVDGENVLLVTLEGAAPRVQFMQFNR